MPAATHANSSRPAQAYPCCFATGRRFRLSRNIIRSKDTTIQIGSSGMTGIWRGTGGGARNDSVVVSVDVQNADAVLVAAVGVQVTAVPSVVDPFLNWTVPVGPTPLLFVVTVAVSVTLAPEVMLVKLGVTVVVVVAF